MKTAVNCEWFYEECQSEGTNHLMSENAFSIGSTDSMHVCDIHVDEAQENLSERHRRWKPAPANLRVDQLRDWLLGKLD